MTSFLILQFFSHVSQQAAGVHQFSDESAMKWLTARSLPWECVPILANASSPLKLALRLKTCMGLPIPEGLDDVGLTFTATRLGHHPVGWACVHLGQ